MIRCYGLRGIILSSSLADFAQLVLAVACTLPDVAQMASTRLDHGILQASRLEGKSDARLRRPTKPTENERHTPSEAIKHVVDGSYKSAKATFDPANQCSQRASQAPHKRWLSPQARSQRYGGKGRT